MCVEINGPCSLKYFIDKDIPLQKDVLQRMEQVLGASNYSLTLRNSEHVARYIQCGAWISFQMVGGGVLNKKFKKRSKEFSAYLNQPPEELKPPKKDLLSIYPEHKFTDHVIFHKTRMKLDEKSNDNYNIVFLGPTGSGKSSLINRLFNCTVMATDNGVKSVTRNIHYSEGEYTFHDYNCKKKKKGKAITIIDTVGMCDSTLSKQEVYNMIKYSLKTNILHIDKVVIVCSGRIESNHVDAIKQFMQWLNYKKYHKRFCFFLNKCESLDKSKRNLNLLDMCEILGIEYGKNNVEVQPEIGVFKTINLTAAMGFHPDPSWEKDKECLRTLVWSTLSEHPRWKRIPLDSSNCTIL